MSTHWIALLILNLTAVGLHVGSLLWRHHGGPAVRTREALRPYDSLLREVEREERRAAELGRGRKIPAAASDDLRSFREVRVGTELELLQSETSP